MLMDVQSDTVYEDYVDRREEWERSRRRSEAERQEYLSDPVWRQNWIEFVSLNYNTLSPFEILKPAREFNVVNQLLELELGEDYTDTITVYNFLFSQIEHLMKHDDVHEFAAFITKFYDKLLNFTPQHLFDLLVDNSAAGCLTALLDSQLRSHVDVNRPIRDGCVFAIGTAAFRLSSRMVTSLLCHGADPDACSSSFEIPLHYAIASFRLLDSMYDWNPAKPILKLFTLICSPELKESLDTIRLLASHSNQVENLCRIYIANREIMKLATLLVVASDKLLVHLDRGLENTPVGSFIFGELSASNSPSSLKIKKLNDAFCVVKTFCLAHGVLVRSVQSVLLEGVPIPECKPPFDILYEFFGEGGPVLEPSTVDIDNIERLRAKLTSEAKVVSQQHHGSIVRAFTRERRIGMLEFSSFLAGSNSSYRSFCSMLGAHFNKLKPMETRLSNWALVKPSSQNGLALMRKAAHLMMYVRRGVK